MSEGLHVDQQSWRLPEGINQPGGFNLIDVFPGLESQLGCLLGFCPNFLAALVMLKHLPGWVDRSLYTQVVLE